MTSRARQRDQAGALADPDRGWDAIVIGEYERAFYGSQYAPVAPLFQHYGIQLWMPEAGGPVGGGEDHEQVMLALGLHSKREITRTRTPDPGPHRHGHPDPGAGPVPRGPPAVRVRLTVITTGSGAEAIQLARDVAPT